MAVGVLRTRDSETDSQWQCKVLTCAETCHPLIACQQFRLLPAQERWDVVPLNSLCKGCLTPGHGTTVRACPFRGELDDLCAGYKCKQAHHQLLHVSGRPGLSRHPRPGQADAASKQRDAQAVAAAVQLEPQPPVQLVTQRIRTAAGRPCITFWDTGSQVTLITHEAAKDMGLKPIPGPPLNLMGVGNSQKTRSTVRYKIPLVDTGGRTVEVAAYGIGHIMDLLETIDPRQMRAVFPEAPTGGIEAAGGGVDLLMGHDNLRLFPVEQRRVEDAMLHRSRFGTGWITSGRPPKPGDRAPAKGAAASAGVRTSAGSATSAGSPTSAESPTSAGSATSAKSSTSAGSATSAGLATSAGAATSAGSSTSAGGPAKQKRATAAKDPAVTATRTRPGLKSKTKDSSDSQNQQEDERSNDTIRTTQLANPSRVVPPVHIEGGIFQPSDFLSAEALGMDMPRRCKNCLKCKECQFRADSLTFKENQEYQVILDGLKFDAKRKKWTAAYPFCIPPSELMDNQDQVYRYTLYQERRLAKEGRTEEFNKQFYETVERGVFKEISRDEMEKWEGPVNYITMVEAFKEGPHSTTPLRICMNSSLRQPKPVSMALNDCLMKGPSALVDLFTVTLGIREH